MFRNLINLVEHKHRRLHIWCHTSKDIARQIIRAGVTPDAFTEGDFGIGFYASDHPARRRDIDPEEGVSLEFMLRDGFHVLTLSHEFDHRQWMRHQHEDWESMVRHGIDGVHDAGHFVFYNPEALHFQRVCYGVVDDPLAETDTSELDEFALGGLRRCTAVTVNALLKDFHLPLITVNEVPVDQPGILAILVHHGLAYRPMPQEVGRTVRQFASLHRLGDWCLITPGHAMALIKGSLFDAENRGPDERRLEAIFEITRR